jgi:glycosyltransferase involved in cell wall biosynthesis
VAFRHGKNLGSSENTAFALSKAKGKYIALCEGDDVWLDESKIEKQLHEMMLHPDINISFHPVLKGMPESNFLYRHLGDSVKVIDDITVAKKGGSFMPTVSLMFQGLCLRSILPYLKGSPADDVLFQIWCSLGKGALYLPWPMALYRTNVDNSWSSKNTSFSARLKHLRQQSRFVKLFVKRLPLHKQKTVQLALMIWLGEKYTRLFKQTANAGNYAISLRALYYAICFRIRKWCLNQAVVSKSSVQDAK